MFDHWPLQDWQYPYEAPTRESDTGPTAESATQYEAACEALAEIAAYVGDDPYWASDRAAQTLPLLGWRR
jgi:hypothetical protein